MKVSRAWLFPYWKAVWSISCISGSIVFIYRIGYRLVNLVSAKSSRLVFTFVIFVTMFKRRLCLSYSLNSCTSFFGIQERDNHWSHGRHWFHTACKVSCLDAVKTSHCYDNLAWWSYYHQVSGRLFHEVERALDCWCHWWHHDRSTSSRSGVVIVLLSAIFFRHAEASWLLWVLPRYLRDQDWIWQTDK